MGEEPSTSGSAVSGEARDPEEIRREIEATRQKLGDTIEALAEKTDLKAQAKHKIEETKAYFSEKTDGLLGKKDNLLGKANEASTEGAASAPSQATQKARENLIALAAIGALALGFVIWRRSRRPRTATPR